MRSIQPLSLACAVAVIMLMLAGAALAGSRVRPSESPPSVRAMRAVVDHYRKITWMYERAAHVRRTPSSLAYRRSSDRAFLQWTIDRWTRRAYVARRHAVARIEHRLGVDLPAPPRLHARLFARVRYSRRLALRLRRIYPGTVTRGFASARGATGRDALRIWQVRSAAGAVAVALHAHRAPPALPSPLVEAFTCIHQYEGAWNSNTGNGYYGGLQMDVGFQRRYGSEFLGRWGTADNWPAWAQLQAAVRAYSSGRGFSPWPNTARACGLV